MQPRLLENHRCEQRGKKCGQDDEDQHSGNLHCSCLVRKQKAGRVMTTPQTLLWLAFLATGGGFIVCRWLKI